MEPNELLDFLDQASSEIAQVQSDFKVYNDACYPKREANFFSLELCGEAGELANKEKKIWKGKSIPPSELEEEAADVLIALINYSNSRGINLGDAFAAKVREIEKRRLAE